METGSALRQGLGLLVLGLVAGTLANATASPGRRLHWVGSMSKTTAAPPPVAAATPLPSDPAAAAPASDPAAGAGIEIGIDRAIAEHQAGAVFLDARRSDAYADGRIPGARSFAVWEADVDDKVVGLMGELPPDTHIVTYCTGGRCEDSHLLREKLLAAGYTEVYVFHDGMPGWKDAGQAVEK